MDSYDDKAEPYIRLWTDRQLSYMRENAIAELRKHKYYAPDVNLEDPELFTCDKCPNRAICRSVYDLYNLLGDCIEEK